VEFRTKPRLAWEMIAAALVAGLQAPWATSDEADGQDPQLRAALEGRGIGYAITVACATRVRINAGRTPVRAEPPPAGCPPPPDSGTAPATARRALAATTGEAHIGSDDHRHLLVRRATHRWRTNSGLYRRSGCQTVSGGNRPMSATAGHRPQMSEDEFEQLTAHAPKTLTLEFINGKLAVRPVRNGDNVRSSCGCSASARRPARSSTSTSSKGSASTSTAPVTPGPTVSWPPSPTPPGQGEWADPTGALMVAGVTSYDPDTDRRYRVKKPLAYGATGIPVYLLIDRDTCETLAHSEPEDGKYRTIRSHPFGSTFEIADLGITLETEILKQYVR
jgi:Uma2 family endonuclease